MASHSGLGPARVPVSALIHAATMVAAGVYMLCRVFFLFELPPAWPAPLSFLGHLSALDVIAWTGGLTSLFAGVIAIQQDDIKRILAYSTLSQLGYMVMAVGCGGPDAAMFHLTTHACFKALLFLGAGSVIYACHHEQNIWKMGGLATRMPVTFWTFMVATAALCGLPVVSSGFYSKDAIFAAALAPGYRRRLARRGCVPGRGAFTHDRHRIPRRGHRRFGQPFLRNDPLPDRARAGYDLPALGLHARAADCGS